MSTLKESQKTIEPVEHAFGITPSDVDNLIHKTRAISTNGVLADLDVVFAGGERVTITLSPGIIHQIRAIKIWTTNTTATGIIGYY